MLRDEARWALYRQLHPQEAAGADYHGVEPIGEMLPPDIVAEIDQRLSLREASA